MIHDLNTSLGAFNQELRVIYVFLKSVNIGNLRVLFNLGKKFEIFITKKGFSAHQNKKDLKKTKIKNQCLHVPKA